MHVPPVLDRLRHDPGPQRLAQQAMEEARDAWTNHRTVAPIIDELEFFGAGRALADCPRLSELVRSHEAALRFAELLVSAHARPLCDNPLGHVALRHRLSEGLAVLQLHASGRATLSLVAYSPSTAGPAKSVCFSDGERHEMVLAGRGEVRLFTLAAEGPASAELICETRSLFPGDRLSMADRTQSRIVEAPHACMVLLRLTREAEDPAPSREYRIADGALAHVASGNRAESRDEMAMAVLGALGRADAVPALSDVAGQGSDHLRWQAVRHVLALDSGAGFALLSRLAGDPLDSLARPAGALRSSLLETYPQLARASEPCLS